MKNISVNSDEGDIEQARTIARERSATLNEVFREWLQIYAGQERDRDRRRQEYRALMKRLSYWDLGGKKFTHEEMNERHPKWDE